MNVIGSAAYQSIMKSMVLLVLSGFLWALAVPYIYSFTDEATTRLEYFNPVGNDAEEENVESFSDFEKDLKLRFSLTDNQLTTAKHTISFNSPEAFFSHLFMEIPNPPPETTDPLL